MNLFKTLVNQFVNKEGEDDECEEAVERTVKTLKWSNTALQEWADVAFDTSQAQEANLYVLWQQTEARRVDSAIPRSAFTAFLREFVSAFDAWQPDEDPTGSGVHLPSQQQMQQEQATAAGSPRNGLSDVKASFSLRTAGSFTMSLRSGGPSTPRSGGPGASNRTVLIGCKLGHPKAIMEAMISCLGSVATGLAEAMTKDSYRFEELQDVVYLHVLRALIIVMRSHHNRFAVLSLRGVEGLAEVLKLVNLRLNSITALISVESAYLPREWQLSLLQCVAAHVVACLHNYTCGEISSASRPTADGSNIDFDKLERVVRPLVQHNLLSHYIELIRLVGLLRVSAAASSVQYQLESVVFSGCAVSLAHSITAQHHLRTSGSLDVLLERLGWPSAVAAATKPEDTEQGLGKFTLDEFRSQLAALNVLGAAIRRNRNNLRYMRDHGGFQRVAHMVQWVVATFHSNSIQSVHRSKDASADNELSGALLKVFAILQSWISQMDDVPGSVVNLTDSLAKDVLEVLLSIFNEAPPKASARELHEHVLQLVRTRTCTLQLHIVALMNQLVASSPTAVNMLRKLNVREALFGPAFFYFTGRCQSSDELEHSWISLHAPTSPTYLSSQPSRSQTSSQKDLTEDPSATLAQKLDYVACRALKALVPYPKFSQERARLGLRVVNDVVCGPEVAAAVMDASRGLNRSGSLMQEVPESLGDVSPADRLRIEVIQFTETMALMPGAHGGSVSNSDLEVAMLLRAMDQGLGDDWQAVLLAAAALQRVIKSPVQETILQVLSKQGALHIFANALVQVQAAGTDLSLGSKAQLLHHSAQEAVLELLGSFLECSAAVRRTAIRNPSILKALFVMVLDDTLRAQALALITILMDVQPQGETERLSKAVLFARFAELLPGAKQQWQSHGIGLVVDLLSATQDIIRRNPSQHQALLREANFTSQLIQLLDEDYPSRLALSLCEHVLTTLQVLLAKNQASREQLKTAIGYNTLCRLILKCAGGSEPGKALLVQVLGLVIEEEFDPSSKGQYIANMDALVLFFRLVQHSPPAAQVWGLDAWMQLLRDNLSNQAACQQGSINALLVDWLATCNDVLVQDKLAQLLQMTGAYGISTKDLRGIMRLLHGEQRSVPRHSGVVLRMLHGMIRPSGPLAYFQFSSSKAGILRAEQMKWPSKGITVSMWLRTEALAEAATQSIFSFLCKRSHGISGLAASLQDDHLTLRSQQDCKTLHVVCTFQVQRGRWYHLVVSHGAGSMSLSSAMTKVYVDGILLANVKLRYPAKPEYMNSVVFGAALSKEDSGINTTIGPWVGQLGPVYVLEEAVNDNIAKVLFTLGHDFHGVFSSSQLNSSSGQVKESLASRLICGYHPCGWADGALMDLAQFSPKGSSSVDTSAVSAELLPGTSVHHTSQLHDSLQCLGGVDIFIPLIAQLDLPLASATGQQAPGCAMEAGSRLVDTMGLIFGVLQQHSASRIHWVQLQGFALVASLLQQRNPRHLSVAFLEQLEKMVPQISSWPANIAYHFFEHLLVNFRLWSQAPFEAQQRHQQLLLQQNQYQAGPLVKVVTATHLLHALRLHYWHTQTSDSGPAAGGGNMSAEEVAQLRRGLLELVSSLATNSSTQQARLPLVMEDVEAWTAFLGDCSDARMAEDVVNQLSVLARPSSPCSFFLMRHMVALGGPKLVLPLLQREPVNLRLAGLRLLAVLVRALSPSQLAASLDTGGEDTQAINGFWAAVSDALLVHPLQRGMRLALLDLLCTVSPPPPKSPIASPRQLLIDAMSTADSSSSGNSGAGHRTIVAPAVMGILCRLLRACSNAEERLATLEALSGLFEGNRKNLEAILMQPSWYCWLLDLLLDGSPCNAPGEDTSNNSTASDTTSPFILPTGSLPSASRPGHPAFQWHSNESQLIRAMLRSLYVHAMLHLQQGWQHLRNSAAYLQGCTARGVVDGWGLVHFLLADLLEVLVGPDGDGARKLEGGNGPEAWTVVLGMLAGPARQNSMELLGLLDSLLCGVLVTPAGEICVPWPTALNWAYGNLEDDTPDAWSMLGASSITPFFSPPCWTPAVWRLHSNIWKLLRILRASPDGFALPQKLQGVLSRSIAPLQESGMFRQLRNSTVTQPALNGEALGSQTSEQVINACVLDRPLRIATRLLLWAIQFGPEDAAEESLQDAHSLIPRMLAQCSQANDRLHLLLSSLIRTNTMLQERQAGVMQFGEAWRKRLSRKMLDIMLQDIWAQLQNSLKNDANSLAGVLQPDEAKAAAVLRADRVVRCLRGELQFMAWMSYASSSTQTELERQLEALSMGEHQQLKAISQQARQELASLCSANLVRRARLQLAWEEQRQTVAKSLKQLQRSLTGETGIWYRPDTQPKHWKLDMHEDRLRRRLVMKRNYNFTQYKDPPKGGGRAPASILASASSLKETGLAKVAGSANRTEDDGAEEPAFLEDALQDSSGNDDSGFAGRWEVQAALGASILGNDVPVGALQEPVVFSSAVKLIGVKGNLDGKLEFTQTYLHIYGEMAPDSLSIPRNAPTAAGAESNDLETTAFTAPTLSKSAKKHYRFQVSKVVEILQARYMLQTTALEIFFVNGSNLLLNFPSWALAEDCAAAMCDACSHIRFLDNNKKREAAHKLQQKWQNWQISNFEYIMQLNKCACRTYNDLNQYPVFPWVLADYTSSSLDFTNPATFRDLSKPIGATSEKRRQFFIQRFDSMKGDPDVNPFHYGSHYSSSAIVLYYMIRLEPFTALNRHLQGGRFDHADRLFHSIPATWNCVLENTTDVKELIPEFFYLPDFLRNSNQFDLGTRQDGVQLENVILPPWANNNPEEFVRIHREALESEYVSEHLNEWIDLIFGYKQRGTEAERAVNVFYHLTYEGAVDLASIEDEMKRRAIADQITNFGQTPGQLFKKRHPKKGPPPPPSAHLLYNAPDVVRLAVQIAPTGSSKQEQTQHISRVQFSAGRVIMATSDRCVSCHRWLGPKDLGTFTFSSGTADLSYEVELDSNRPRILGPPGEFSLLSSCNTWTVLPGTRAMLSCAHWDRSIKLHSAEDGRLLQSACWHQDIVTAVAVSPEGLYVASGSADTTVAVWDLVYGSSRPSKPPTLSPSPQQVLHGHQAPISCLAISADMDLVVSGSSDGVLHLRSPSTGAHRRSLSLPGQAAPSLLTLNVDTGHLVVHSHTDCSLHVYSVNGVRQASAQLNEKLFAMELAWDGRSLLCGGEKGVVVLRWLHSLEVVMRWEERALRSPVTAICATPEDCFIAGTTDGQLLVYTPDPRRRVTKRIAPVAAHVSHLK